MIVIGGFVIPADAPLWVYIVIFVVAIVCLGTLIFITFHDLVDVIRDVFKKYKKLFRRYKWK